MNPGDSRPTTQSVSVNYLDDPSDQRYSGTLSGTYTYAGTFQLTLTTQSPGAALHDHRAPGKRLDSGAERRFHATRGKIKERLWAGRRSEGGEGKHDENGSGSMSGMTSGPRAN
jgi:hypothetical protein